MTKDATIVAAKRELVDRERGWRIGGIVTILCYETSYERHVSEGLDVE